jgi:hypothetical protein
MRTRSRATRLPGRRGCRRRTEAPVPKAAGLVGRLTPAGRRSWAPQPTSDLRRATYCAARSESGNVRMEASGERAGGGRESPPGPRRRLPRGAGGQPASGDPVDQESRPAVLLSQLRTWRTPTCRRHDFGVRQRPTASNGTRTASLIRVSPSPGGRRVTECNRVSFYDLPVLQASARVVLPERSASLPQHRPAIRRLTVLLRSW